MLHSVEIYNHDVEIYSDNLVTKWSNKYLELDLVDSVCSAGAGVLNDDPVQPVRVPSP